MPEPLPAISLVAVPGRRRHTLDIAREIERRGFCGIYMPSRYGNMLQCTGLALASERIRLGTAIAPIYAQTTEEFASGAAYIHEFRADVSALVSASPTARPSGSVSPRVSRWPTPALQRTRKWSNTWIMRRVNSLRQTTRTGPRKMRPVKCRPTEASPCCGASWNMTRSLILTARRSRS
jgi:hypothetical protein